MAEVEGWLATQETAKAMLGRVVARIRTRSLSLPAPLEGTLLGLGDVLEIVGPSGSGKSQLLLEVAVTCILPKQWDGVSYGGLEGTVVMFDLDCRFNMLRLLHLLHQRIGQANGISKAVHEVPELNVPTNEIGQEAIGATVEGLFYEQNPLVSSCLKRFIYTRCYNSFDFLCALKTMRTQLKGLSEKSSGMQLILIDSIGAFHWLDRSLNTTISSSRLEVGRTSLSAQVVSKAVVRELQFLLETNPALILASKPLVSNPMQKERVDAKGYLDNQSDEILNPDSKSVSYRDASTIGKTFFREYMPAAWQAFVTHRLLLQGPFYQGSTCGFSYNEPYFTAEWEMPCLKRVDKFFIQDSGIKKITSL